MVAALTALLFASSPPVASFVAPTTVTVGAPVSYLDRSYDPAPGHYLILEIWIGRQPAFQVPGMYTISLTVEDDRGLWSTASRTIQVVAPQPPPPPPPPPPAVQGTLVLSTTSARRGDRVTLTLRGPGADFRPQLQLPPQFAGKVALPTGTLDYGTVERAPWRYQNGSWSTTIWVPWTRDTPVDGVYTFRASWSAGSRTGSASAALTVRGTDRLADWLIL